MNLRSVDLNLLVVFDALLGELHVTRAANKVGLSQPAMSNALGRLRHIFNDELLVRTAAGMQATPRAVELANPVRQVLRQIEHVFESAPAFDPTTSTRHFNIRMSDVLAMLLLPKFLINLEKRAPAISVDISHTAPGETVEALERDELDLAVSMGLVHSTSVRSEFLMPDRMVCVMRKDHPLSKVKLTLTRFLAARHLRVAMSPTDLRFVDNILADEGHKRDVAMNIPHWLNIPMAVSHSDLISVMPERLALALDTNRMAVCDLPFTSAPFEWALYWHRRHDSNPAIIWLRELLKSACA
ncbi:MAG: LysR family transcriptional regulator [Rhodospirillales bacterium]